MKHRIIFTVAILGIAHLSWAQIPLQPQVSREADSRLNAPPARAPLGASVFYLLTIGNSEKRPTFWADTLGDSSITEADISKIRSYGLKAVAANLDFQYKELDRVCANKDNLITIDTVASALTEFDAHNASNIEQLGNDAPKSLGDRLGRLLIQAAGKSVSTVSETDHKKMIALQKRDPVEVIQKFCAKSSSRPSL